MPESIVMRPALRHLCVIVSLEGGVILYSVVSSIHQSVTKSLGTALGHACFLRLEVAGLINRGIKTGKREKLLGPGETADIADFAEDHTAIDVTHTGDGKDDRVGIIHDVSHFQFNAVNLLIQEFDLLNGVNDLDGNSGVGRADRIPCQNS